MLERSDRIREECFTQINGPNKFIAMLAINYMKSFILQSLFLSFDDMKRVINGFPCESINSNFMKVIEYCRFSPTSGVEIFSKCFMPLH